MASIKMSGKSLIDEINKTSLPPGTIAFWWLGQSSFVFKGQQTVVYIDPYLSADPRRLTPAPLAPDEVDNADVVLCTHDHKDHIDPGTIPGIAKASPKAVFVVPRPAAERMTSLGVAPERLKTVNPGQRLELADSRIVGVKAKHEFFDEDPQHGFPYLGYAVELNRVRFYHAGDGTPYEGLLPALQSVHPQIVFVPINGRDAARLARKCYGNFTFQEAVDLVGELKPRLAVPMHYDMFAQNSEDPAKFVDYLNVKFPGIASWVGGVGERVVVTAE